MSGPARLSADELQAYAAHARATADRPLLELVTELLDARAALADAALLRGRLARLEDRIRRLEAELAAAGLGLD